MTISNGSHKHNTQFSFENCAAGDEFGILILTYLEVIFLFIDCFLKEH
jgi:hypothetical protein